MGMVNLEEVKGVRLDSGLILCQKCMEEPVQYKEDDFIMQDEIENPECLYFCNECKESL